MITRSTFLRRLGLGLLVAPTAARLALKGAAVQDAPKLITPVEFKALDEAVGRWMATPPRPIRVVGPLQERRFADARSMLGVCFQDPADPGPYGGCVTTHLCRPLSGPNEVFRRPYATPTLLPYQRSDGCGGWIELEDFTITYDDPTVGRGGGWPSPCPARVTWREVTYS